jgi:DNA-binding HxlR family transcriptional regulator
MKKILVSLRKAVSSGKVTSFVSMNRTEHEGIPMTHQCISRVRPITDALYVLNGKWKLPVIFTLRENAQRFNEIMKSLEGITPKVLAKELRDLESNGFILRKVFPTTPVTVIYESTSYSDSLRGVLGELYSWGEQHREKIKESMRKA